MSSHTGSIKVFGEVSPPPGVAAYGDAAAGGLILFVSNMIKLVTVVAGLFVVFNVIYAGVIYISSMGDAKAHSQVRDQITYSIVGLLIIIASYAIAMLIGAIFFGSATYIISPEVCGPGGC